MTRTTLSVDADELPLERRPAIEGWSENYCNHAYCPDAGVGFWTHLSRLAGRGEIWRDVLVVYLPGERFLVAKGFGRNRGLAGPGAGMLSLSCDEPWRRWTMRFAGTVRDVTTAELASGSLRDGFHQVAELELSWDAIAPVWDLGDRMREQTWAQAHYEQACTVSGELVFGDESWTLSGAGIRDHSRGVRRFGTVREHWWLTGQLPSGRSFAVLQVINHERADEPLNRAYLSDGTNLVDAAVKSIETLERTADGSPLATRTTLVTPHGEHVIEGRILQTMPFAMGDPNELILGTSSSAPLVLSECQTEYRWAAEVGYGLTERSRTPEAGR
jgi:hypothetical protein